MSDEMPEGLAELAEKKGFTEVGQFAKSYTDMESKYSQIINSTPKAPESMDAYKVEGIEGIDQTRVDAFKQIAFDNKIQPDVFNGIVKWQVENETAAMKKMQEEVEAQTTEAEAGFLKTLGDNPDKVFEDALALADKIGIGEMLKEKGMEKDPIAINILQAVQKMTSEDTIPVKKGSSSQSPDEKIAELMNTDAMKNKMHPDHAKVHRQFLDMCSEKASKA